MTYYDESMRVVIYNIFGGKFIYKKIKKIKKCYY